MRSLVAIFLFLLISSCQNEENIWWTENDRQLILNQLNRTTKEVIKETEDLSDGQWNFKEDTSRWSIAEIVEHLILQNQLHYRELSVISKSPQHLAFRRITRDQDSFFTTYATDTLQGQASWFLEPVGRFCEPENELKEFQRVRSELSRFVQGTNVDLRKQFTFRSITQGKPIEDLKIGQVRDLHQLLLTGIAHTDRHLLQIREIKQHEKFP